MSMTLDSETAKSIAYQYADPGKFMHVQHEQIDETRWGDVYRTVFRDVDTDRYYAFEWEQGATEMQDYDSFEEQNEFEAARVTPIETVVIKFIEV